MHKLLSAVFLSQLLFLFSEHAHAAAFVSKHLAKHERQHISEVSHTDKLFFFFETAGKASVPPGSPPQYVQAYIMTPDERKIKGPKIDVTDPVSDFQITVEPPILFGSYTVVIENLSAPKAIGTFIKPNVVVKNSHNTQLSTILVKRELITPFNPGDTAQGSFVPFHTFTKNELHSKEAISKEFVSKNSTPILKQNGQLYFSFRPKFSPLGQGKWRLVVTTPDKEIFKSRKITVPTTPALRITFKVKHPIFFGRYTISVENLSATNLPQPFQELVDGLVTVKNSVNKKSIEVAIQGSDSNNPGTIQEGYFTPCPAFIGR
ncbi:MAG TPA: hypothetical protein VN457_01345 [Chlamydiales bacterium]|nr:hypothetical protein [Chlamydiales bacterium]